MKTRNLHQVVTIEATVETVYRALMDSRQHSKITDSKAVIGRNPGSRFSAWDGTIQGFTLFIAPRRSIVQAWRSGDWPEGHYSIASFTFKATRTGTKLTFDQIGIPADKYKGISQGWTMYYWEPMKRMLGKKTGRKENHGG